MSRSSEDALVPDIGMRRVSVTAPDPRGVPGLVLLTTY